MLWTNKSKQPNPPPQLWVTPFKTCGWGTWGIFEVLEVLQVGALHTCSTTATLFRTRFAGFLIRNANLLGVSQFHLLPSLEVTIQRFSIQMILNSKMYRESRVLINRQMTALKQNNVWFLNLKATSNCCEQNYNCKTKGNIYSWNNVVTSIKLWKNKSLVSLTFSPWRLQKGNCTQITQISARCNFSR